MSLKAKLEAVIYAAEEPVTLAQLALLFTADALEWKAEQEAYALANPSLATGESLPPESGEIDYGLLEPGPVEVARAINPEQANLDQVADREPTGETDSESAAGEGETAAKLSDGEDATLGQTGGETTESGSDAEAEASQTDEAAAEATLKREAKQRDREVRAILRQLLDEVIADYASDNRGVEIREIAGGYRMATKPECHDAVRAFVKSLKPALKLSLPALETLAVVAYKQPVTAPEVNEIRGVDSSGVFGSLLARKLIATAGRKQVIGRPILYKTTKEFLLRFGLKDVAELPSMEEFEKLAAIELDEPELAGPEESSPEIREDLRLEEDAAQAAELAESADGEATTPEVAPAAPPPTE
ncbi:MAG TPA: SMC-Scp complex subunit ScpB [Terracidiphilus sp.]|nr:SMC-Scp complex subunit ScpB [Terracidiphilus sp.]HUX28900.1 SMC-Scp complex subunit ScpB [Terracidiphilus sp.]